MEKLLTERQKVQELYRLIGDRGLYVNSNFDVFTQKPEEIVLNTGYKVPLIQEGARAYASPLLFATLTSLLNHGTMLITGAPGIGKTTGAEFAGHFFTSVPLNDILEAELIGNPQLKTEDVIATLDTVQMVHDGKKVVIPTKFLKSPVKIWDEINRTPPDMLSAAMKLVDTGKAVYQGELLVSPPGVLFATANYTDQGTFELTPPFLDRFDAAVMVTSPPQWDLKKIRQRGDEKLNGNLEQLLIIPEHLKLDHDEIRKQINALEERTEYDVGVASAFADFIYGSLRFSEAASDTLARSTKGNAWQMSQDNAPAGHFSDNPFTYTVNESSIRSVKTMQRYAKAFAWMNGRDKIEIDDLKTVVPYLLWHKIQPTSKALTENPKYANDRIAFVEGLVQKIENDYQEMLGSTELKLYALSLDALRTNKLGERNLSKEDVRNVVRNALGKIGAVDKPYALTLASHLASEYNSKLMEESYERP